jgi:hypothetical protein
VTGALEETAQLGLDLLDTLARFAAVRPSFAWQPLERDLFSDVDVRDAVSAVTADALANRPAFLELVAWLRGWLEARARGAGRLFAEAGRDVTARDALAGRDGESRVVLYVMAVAEAVWSGRLGRPGVAG